MMGIDSHIFAMVPSQTFVFSSSRVILTERSGGRISRRPPARDFARLPLAPSGGELRFFTAFRMTQKGS